mmetsp:Transcript_8713/g.24873  ORF Transcript_8713/g.24873 Transcript_8713/m.24873 type:complete len:257 (+) Transcript_8713:1552-2322(+)
MKLPLPFLLNPVGLDKLLGTNNFFLRTKPPGLPLRKPLGSTFSAAASSGGDGTGSAGVGFSALRRTSSSSICNWWMVSLASVSSLARSSLSWMVAMCDISISSARILATCLFNLSFKDFSSEPAPLSLGHFLGVKSLPFSTKVPFEVDLDTSWTSSAPPVSFMLPSLGHFFGIKSFFLKVNPFLRNAEVSRGLPLRASVFFFDRAFFDGAFFAAAFLGGAFFSLVGGACSACPFLPSSSCSSSAHLILYSMTSLAS